MSGLVGPDGKPTAAKVAIPLTAINTPVGKLPMRKIPLEGVMTGKIDPINAFLGMGLQLSDQNTLALTGMYLLAKDIYSRQPEGERNFQELCEMLGVEIMTIDKKKIDFTAELKAIK